MTICKGHKGPFFLSSLLLKFIIKTQIFHKIKYDYKGHKGPFFLYSLLLKFSF